MNPYEIRRANLRTRLRQEPPVHPPVHLLDTYTWAGRRGACAATSQSLPAAHVWAEVTCERCLALTPRPLTAREQAIVARFESAPDPWGDE